MANSWMDQILNYENSGAIRNKPVSSELETAIRNGVLAVYGDGYTVDIISGGQGGGRTTGSRRHTTGGAADVYIKDPRGNRVTGDALIPMAQHWRAQNLGGVGFPAKANQSMHLDLIGGIGKGSIPLGPGEGMTWFYGTPTAAQRRAILSGEAPKYALNYDQISKGLLPPESLNGVASLTDVEDLGLSLAPIPRHPAIGERARAAAAARAPQPAPFADAAKARNREELKAGFSRAGTERMGDFTLRADERKPINIPQSSIERVVSKTPLQQIPQSQIERVASTKTPQTAQRSIPQSIIERNPPKQIPGQSTIERNPPKSGPKIQTLGTLTPTNTPGVSRINGSNQAGQVAMPKDVRPNVTVPNLDRIAETLPGGSNERAIPGSSGFAGQDNAKPTSSKAKVGLSTPLSPTQTAIERVKPSDLTMRVAAAPPNKTPVTDIGSQQVSAKDKRARNAAAAMGEQAVIAGVKPPSAKPSGASGKKDDPMSAVLSALGFGETDGKSMQKGISEIFSGIDGFFSGIAGPRKPLTSQQIATANANSQNHNSAALAAINRGERGYDAGGGAVNPTTTIGGKDRNTYGDTGGSLV